MSMSCNMLLLYHLTTSILLITSFQINPFLKKNNLRPFTAYRSGSNRLLRLFRCSDECCVNSCTYNWYLICGAYMVLS